MTAKEIIINVSKDLSRISDNPESWPIENHPEMKGLLCQCFAAQVALLQAAIRKMDDAEHYAKEEVDRLKEEIQKMAYGYE